MSIGICVVGNNTIDEDKWTLLQISSLMDLIVSVVDLWPGINVCGHRDLGQTQCPGLDVTKFVEGERDVGTSI